MVFFGCVFKILLVQVLQMILYINIMYYIIYLDVFFQFLYYLVFLNSLRILQKFSRFSHHFQDFSLNQQTTCLHRFYCDTSNRFGKYSHPHYTAIDISPLCRTYQFSTLARKTLILCLNVINTRAHTSRYTHMIRACNPSLSWRNECAQIPVESVNTSNDWRNKCKFNAHNFA